MLNITKKVELGKMLP